MEIDLPLFRTDARPGAWLIAIGWLFSTFLAPTVLAGESLESSSGRPAADRLCSFLVVGGSVYRACEDAEVVQLDLGVSYFGGSVDHGERGAVPSPDHRRVAYLRDHDVWVYDSDTDERRRITWVGQPHEPPWAEVAVSIKAWSSDNDRVIYHVGSPEGPGCEEPAEPIQLREAPYGFHVYDLELGEDRLLADTSHPQDRLPVDHFAWLPDGSFLIVSSSTPDEAGFTLMPAAPIRLGFPRFGRGSGQRHLVGVSGDGSSATLVASLPGPPVQPYLSHDGRWLSMIVVVPGDPGKTSNSQLWRVNLESGEASAVTAVGDYAQFQWPRVSPTGERIAYVCDERTGASIVETLVVDGKCLSACPTGVRMRFEWVSDEVLSVACGERLIVLNAETGTKVTQGHCAAAE